MNPYRKSLAALALSLTAIAHAANPSIGVGVSPMGPLIKYTFNVDTGGQAVTSFHVVSKEKGVVGDIPETTEPGGWSYTGGQGGDFSWETPTPVSGSLSFSVTIDAAYKMLPLSEAYLDSPTNPHIPIPSVPEPAAPMSAAAGLAVLAIFRRWKRTAH